ncbi:MFS transporter [Candidatus Gottesmanbacteria bacterium]|nr:MFS transporter [Candidatus Gottesmanbacteria bacterium]
MQKFKSSSFIIFLIVFINFLGYGIVFPTLPLLTESYGGTPFLSGIFIAAFSFMQVLAMPILGRLSDKYGRRPLLLFSLWGTFFSFFLMGITHSLLWLLIARIIDGASGGNLSIAQAYIADITDRKNRSSGMGIIGAGITLGFIIGPVWGGIFSKISPTAPYFSAAVITLISILLTQFLLPESVSKKEKVYEKSHFNFATLFKHFRNAPLFILFIVTLLLFWGQSGVYTTLSLLGNDVFHLTLLKTSLLFAFGGILSAFIQAFLIGKVTKFISEEKLLIISAISGTVGFFFMAISENIAIFVVGMTIFSIGNGFLAPISQGLVSELASEHEQGGIMGILQSFGSIGRIIGPLLAGFIYQTLNPFAPSAMGAVVFAGIAILGTQFMRKNTSPHFEK